MGQFCRESALGRNSKQKEDFSRKMELRHGMLLALMVLIIGATSALGAEDKKDGRFLSMFEVVNFPNDACDGDSKNGTCYTAAECEKKGGDDAGSCADGYGVCCTFKINCGNVIAENLTYFESTGSEDGGCSVKICPVNDNICQLRLDFQTFVISGPYTSTALEIKALNGQGATSGTGGNYGSRCLTDIFTVTNPDGPAPPAICGSNSGEHMYVEASQACNELAFQIGSTTKPMWTVAVTQYECTYNNLAPAGCTQWYYGNKNGVIKTYNYQSGAGSGVHLADQKQNICIRREKGNSKICYATAIYTDFEVSGIQDAAIAMRKGLTKDCCNYGTDGMGKGAKGYDCLLIPDPEGTDGTILKQHGYCGAAGLITADNMIENSGANLKTICSKSQPFMVTFLSDGLEYSAAMATDEAAG